MHNFNKAVFVGLLISSIYGYHPASAAGGSVVFRQDFSTITDLEQAGWVQHGGEDVSEWKLKNDSMEMTFSHKPYKGGSIVHEVPAVSAGELTIETTQNVNYGVFDHMSMQLKLYDLMLTFKFYQNHHLLRYYDGKWRLVTGGLPVGKRLKVRITFDNQRKIVQYFVNDMEHPVMIDEGVVLTPSATSPELIVGNYGLSRGTLTHQIHSIELRETPPPARDASPAPVVPRARLFRGIAFERYRLPDLIKRLGVQKGSVHTLTNRRPALTPKNKFKIDKLPAISTTSVDQYIIMADFPLNEGLLPDVSLKSLIHDVQEGSTLVILGGLFTLNKGEFSKSLLNAIVPVQTVDPWAVKTFDPPLLTPAGVVSQAHGVALKPNAKVLVEIDGHPLWVEGRCGKGRVVVFTGMPCRVPASSLTPFWLHPDWPKYAATVIRGEQQE